MAKREEGSGVDVGAEAEKTEWPNTKRARVSVCVKAEG